MKQGTRRALLGAGAAAIGAAALEYASLRGRFDHRRLPALTGRDRWEEAMRRLRDPAVAAGSVIHVGHSTHLLCIGGARLLTDPWFYDPAFGALSHVTGPAVAPDRIGGIDAVLVTHDHADHFDPKAVDQLDKRATAVVATSYLAAQTRGMGFAESIVLAPWTSLAIKGARVTAVPGVHDIFEIGFVVSAGDRSVYFAGDTRLFGGLAEIGERLTPSMAILPVDGTRLRGSSLHVMTPEDAVQAARTLRVRSVMPSHAEARFSDPLVEKAIATTISGANGLFAQAMAASLPAVACHVPAAGDLVTV